MDSKSLPLVEHLTELRNRLLKILLILGASFALCYFFSGFLLDLASQPIKPYLLATKGQLIFISPLEKFFAGLWVSFFAGLALSCPFWLYQIWRFISPGLYGQEKKWSLMFAASSAFLFLSGVLFAYFIVAPFSFRFLLSLGGGGGLPYISLKPYLSFFLRSSFVFGLAFELPVALFLLLRLNIISVEQVKKARPYILIGIAALSALATPPDVFSMLFLIAPLWLIFECSLWLSQKLLKRKA